MGNLKPFYGNSVKFYENKKAKAVTKIEELKKVIVECDKAIAEIKENENK